MLVFPQVYLTQEINNFRKFFNDKELTLPQLHAIMNYSGIKPVAHDKRGNNIYNAVILKNTRSGTESANGLREAYHKLKELEDMEEEKTIKEVPVQKPKQPVQLSLDLKEGKRIHITESQLKTILENEILNETKQFFVDPDKVLVVKKFLDDTFYKAGMPYIASDGYPATKDIAILKGTDGQGVRKMTSRQVFDMLQDKFSHIYSEPEKRDKFLKTIVRDWYYDKISEKGLLSTNKY